MWKLLTEEEEIQQELEFQQRLEKFRPILDNVTFDEMMLVDNELFFWEEKLLSYFNLTITEDNEDDIMSMAFDISIDYYNLLSSDKQTKFTNRRL
jgi:hypothetical protein